MPGVGGDLQTELVHFKVIKWSGGREFRLYDVNQRSNTLHGAFCIQFSIVRVVFKR